MKDNSVLLNYTKNRPVESRISDGDDDAFDDYGSFGWLRGVRDRAIMLELRRKDGNIVAFPYSWLQRAEFDLSDGITLRFGMEKVTITGRNLDADLRTNLCLFAGITRQRVPWIQEADEPASMEAPPEAIVIERIEFE